MGRIERLQALCGVFGALGVVFFGLLLLLIAALFVAGVAVTSMLEGLHGEAGHLSLPWAAAVWAVVAWVVAKFVLAARLRQLGAMLACEVPGAPVKLRCHARIDITANLTFAGAGIAALVALVLRGDLPTASGVSLASLLALITLLMLILPARVLQVLGDS